MEPDREDRSPAHAWLREAAGSAAWAADWYSGRLAHRAEVDAVLAACRYPKAESGETGMAAVSDGGLTAACAGLGRSRARAGIGIGIGIAGTIDDLAALFALPGRLGEAPRLVGGLAH
jgi:hypothetical protein